MAANAARTSRFVFTRIGTYLCTAYLHCAVRKGLDVITFIVLIVAFSFPAFVIETITRRNSTWL